MRSVGDTKKLPFMRTPPLYFENFQNFIFLYDRFEIYFERILLVEFVLVVITLFLFNREQVTNHF